MEGCLIISGTQADTPRLPQTQIAIDLDSFVNLVRVIDKKTDIEKLTQELKDLKLDPGVINFNLLSLNTSVIKEKIPAINILRRPEIDVENLRTLDSKLDTLISKFDTEVQEQVLINVKYETYIDREKRMADKISSLENYQIFSEFDYDKVKALSAEGREKLKRIKPETLGQASRISGVSPSDISVLTIYLGR